VIPGAPALTLPGLLSQVEGDFPKIIGADAERRAATAKRISTQGAFDPQIFVTQDYLLYNSSTSPGRARSFTGTSVGIEVTTRYGTKLLAGRDQFEGSVKSPASATGDIGSYFVGVKQPLLRDLGINPKLAKEQQARLGEPLADLEFSLTRLDILLEASLAYWKWAATVRKLAVAEEILELAIIRANAVREEIRQEVRAPIDQYEADAEVAIRRQALAQARRAVEEAAFKLQKFLWNGEQPAPPPVLTQLPATALTVDPFPLPDAEADAGRQAALDGRPELRSIAINREVLRVDANLARNDLKPNVDLVFQPGEDLGAGGIGNTLKAGVVFGVPLFQRDARGRLAEADLKTTKLDQEETLTRQTILIEVDDSISNINRAYERFVQAQEALRNNIRLEQGERDKFREGDSTLFLINQRERARADSANRVIDARADWEQARSLYQRTTARL
jgi:outer membrane protein TolC